MTKCKRPSCNNNAAINPYRGVVPIYCSRKCKSIEGVNALRRRRKAKIVERLGGKCSVCGYKKSLAALEFHHTDPSKKEFQINRAYTMKPERIEEELKKCVLLCANCHAEHHEGEIL